MRCPASSSVTSIQRTAGAVEWADLPSVGIRVYYIWLISKKSTRHPGRFPGLGSDDEVEAAERLRSRQTSLACESKQDGKRINALDAPRISRLCRPSMPAD